MEVLPCNMVDILCTFYDCNEEGCLKEFIEGRIKTPSQTKVSFFDIIARENIATDLKKERKQEKN